MFSTRAGAPLAIRPVLLFDGDCGLCTRIVQLVLRADNKRTLCFASLQDEFAREILARHPDLEGVDSVAWVDHDAGAADRVLVRSDAAIQLARYLGFPWNLLAVVGLMPRSVRDRLYDWVAARRRRWFGPASGCSLIPEERNRMVDS